MKVKCLALRPFLFHMTVLAIGDAFATTRSHATDLVAGGLAKYAADDEGLGERAPDLASDARLDASVDSAPTADTEGADEAVQDLPTEEDQDTSGGSVVANEKNETQEKELTDDSDNAGSSEAPVAPVRKRGRSAPKSAD